MNIYFDEAGNSGQNLLDREQPIYIVVSHNFTIEETEKLLAPLKTVSEEFHFNKIKKYPKYQKPIENILNNPLINYDRIKIAYYNKKFALCAHLVDQLVETSLYHSNLPYYENGLNIMFAQSLYLQTEFFDLKSKYLELLELFQKMIRTKDTNSIDNFYLKAEEIFGAIVEDGEKNFFFPILKSKDYIEEILKSINKFSIDLALPSIILLSDIWHKKENVVINIIHDESKQVEFWKKFISFLSNDITQEKIDVGFDNRKIIYPLQINTIETVDSKNNIQIQLADLIGSSFAYYAKNILLKYNENDTMANIIANTKLAIMNVHPLQPDLSSVYKEYKSNKDDVNPLDFLSSKTLDNEEKFNESYPK
ncbi:DUF3800 domain-containing protein [Flavobacterium sp. DGU38]|uniref:DUF3800 domain-containing protein n=1 Tax=Flavobacterium calami TaxID=3139144 RepID=A0ABU9IPH3_9FLAO